MGFYSLKSFILSCLIFCFSYSALFSQSLLSATKQLDGTLDYYIYSEFKNLNNNYRSIEAALLTFNEVYNSTIVIDALNLLAQDKKAEAFELLSSIKIPQNVKKDSIYEIYLYMLAYLYFSNGDYQNSFRLSKEYLDYFPDYKDFYIMLYYNLYSTYKTGRQFFFEKSLQRNILQRINPVLAEPFKRLILEYANDRGKYDLSINYLSKTEDRKLILQFIENTYDLNLLIAFQKIYKTKEFRQAIFLRRTELFILRGLKEKAQSNINQVLSNQQNYNKKFINKFLSLSQKLAEPPEVIKIGFLLPFSIQNTRIKNIISDIQTSINIFFQNSNKQYEFIFADTALRPEVAKKSFKELEKKGVLAIIGPLSRLNSRSLRQDSTDYELPIISLTTQENIGKNYPYFYRYQRNAFKENELLANYAVDYLNASRFVALYDSEDSYQKVLNFNKAINKKKGKLIAVEKIDANQKDLRQAFRKITGIYRYLNRTEQKFYQKIEDDETLQEARIDVLYLPFSPQRIHLISSFFSSYNLTDAYILTNGEANLPELKLLTLNKLYLADNFSLLPTKDPLFKEYTDYYRLTKRDLQPTIYGIATYELLQLIDNFVTTFGVADSQSLKLRLDRINYTPFINSKLQIDSNGELSKEYDIYRLYRNKLVNVF